MAKTNSPTEIVDNGNYVTFLYGANSTPIDLNKDVCSITYIPCQVNNARYPAFNMVSAPLINIKSGDLSIMVDQRYVTTPVSANASALYTTILGYFNTNPSIITEVTDPLVITEITDANNWDESGSYKGSTAGLVAGSYYYDTTNKLKYEFDGNTLIRINFNTEV